MPVAGCSLIDFCDYFVRLFHKRYPPDSDMYRLDKSMHFRPGVLVSARYTGDSAWYRARIVAFLQKTGFPFHCCVFRLLFCYTSV